MLAKDKLELLSHIDQLVKQAKDQENQTNYWRNHSLGLTSQIQNLNDVQNQKQHEIEKL